MPINYTQGPWKYRPEVVPAHGFYIETEDMSHNKTFIGEVGGGLHSMAEVEANAKLVSASPDLLNACKAALSYIREIPTDFDEGLEEGDISLVDQLKMAIEKATV